MNYGGVVAAVTGTWRTVLRMWKEYPVVLLPFVAIGVVNALILALLFYAPRPPVSYVLAPIIRTFWGDQFLHYPANFLLLPRLFDYARTAADFVFGALLCGIAVSLLEQAYRRMPPRWLEGMRRGAGRYPRIVLVWALIFAAVAVLTRASLPLLAAVIPSPKMLVLAEFLLAMSIQILFISAVPAIIIENSTTLQALKDSVLVAGRNILPAVSLVAAAGIAFVPLVYVSHKLPSLVGQFSPDITLGVLGVRLVLMTVIDLLVVSGVTAVFLMNREGRIRSS